MTCELLYLSQKDVAACVSVPEVIGIVEAVYRAHGIGVVQLPPKITLDMGETGGWPHLGGAANVMPAYIEPLHAMGVKWAAGFFDNPARGLPSVTAVIVLNDPHTGVPVAVMDGTLITNLRTGAAGVVAAKHLAKEPCRDVALIGAGRQGKTLLAAFETVFPEASLRIYDRNVAAAAALAQEAARGRAAAFASPEEVCDGADVIVTATTSRVPIIKQAWAKSGCLVVSLGSFQELEDDLTLGADGIIVDSWEQNTHRGELVHLVATGRLTRNDIRGEIGAVIAGQIKGRRCAEETILACLIGVGSLDIGVAYHVYQTARAKGRGTVLELF